jgi:hypothetical protein
MALAAQLLYVGQWNESGDASAEYRRRSSPKRSKA